VIVIDASILANVIGDDGGDGLDARQRLDTTGVDVLHALAELPGELPAGQMDIAQRGVSVTVPGERGDRVDLPAHPRQVRQAQVPGRVRGEPLDTRGQGDPADHLRPGPQAQRLGTVATRLRQELRPLDRLTVARCARYCDSSTPVEAEYGTTRSSRFFVVSARTRSVRCAGSTSSVRSEHSSSRRSAAS
jgi:hypothetical protein